MNAPKDTGLISAGSLAAALSLAWRAIVGVLTAAAVFGLAIAGACQSGGPAPGSDPSAHYHVRSAASANAGKPWVVLLPGSSGLTIFEDDRHYFRAAKKFNEAGFDAIVVDYKPAYRASKGAPPGSTGEKIAWVTGRAIEWAMEQGRIQKDAPGAIIVWSLGGEGLWRMAADSEFMKSHNIRAAAAYYPSNQEEQTLEAAVPLLILTGEADDVVKVEDVKAMVAKRDRSGAGEVTLKAYPGAHHGFDISSLTKKRTMELIPIIGPRATIQYDATAAADAEARLVEFLWQAVQK